MKAVVVVADGVTLLGGRRALLERSWPYHITRPRAPTLRSTVPARARTDLAAASMFVCVDTASTLAPVLLPRMRRVISPLSTSHSRMSLSLEDE